MHPINKKPTKTMANFVTKAVSLEELAKNEQIDTTQTRAKLNPVAVTEYVEATRNGEKFPAVTLFHDGNLYWIADGFHRIACAKVLELEEIVANVHNGGYRDAVLFGLQANRQHGLRPSQADKRAMVLKVLQEENIFQLSERQIAEFCGVSHTYIQMLREELLQRDLRLQIGVEDTLENPTDEEGNPMLQDASGNIVTGDYEQAFLYGTALRGSIKILATEIRQLGGLLKDCNNGENLQLAKLAKDLARTLRMLRDATNSLRFNVVPYSITNKEGVQTETYSTKLEYENGFTAQDKEEPKQRGRKKQPFKIAENVIESAKMTSEELDSVLQD